MAHSELRDRGGAALLAATREQQLEVAKRLDSRYLPGGRSGGWLKIKNSQRQELVIGGWTSGKRSRSKGIGALHLGVQDEDGKLRYTGRVGTGFDSQELKLLALLLKPLARKTTPFAGSQPPAGAHFVTPRLVCEVEFTEWTKAGTLRHPAYKGLREDKPAKEVVREQVTAASPRKKRSGTAVNVHAWLEHGRNVRGGVEIEVEGRTLRLTNLEKVLYPKAGFTKSDLIDYYAAIAPALLPHLQDRPLTLKRYPNGVEGRFFYEKQSPKHRPDWVQTTTVWSRHSKREIHFTLCQDLPTLIWLANLADIELHPSLSLAESVERPTTLASDLDPGRRQRSSSAARSPWNCAR
jgi:bifunctional non-homologous end joining protein LigD